MTAYGNRTYIACRPGMKQAMESSFAGVEVVVDDTLTTDYEFRERELTGIELLEEELDKEERLEADPKNAWTFVVPMAMTSDDFAQDPYNCQYLTIRVERSRSNSELTCRKVIRETKVSGDLTDGVNITATMSDVRANLKAAGYNVLSVSQADGVCLLEGQ